jgi:hypothetical protein
MGSNSRYTFAFSRRKVPEACMSLSLERNEGAGNAGCALHPRSRVQNCAKNAHTSIQGSGGDPTFPAQWLYGLYALTPEYRAFLPPSPCGNRHVGPVGLSAPPQDLTPTTEASGPHDFAARFGTARQHAIDCSQVIKPALQSHRAHDAAASTASHPNVR